MQTSVNLRVLINMSHLLLQKITSLQGQGLSAGDPLSCLKMLLYSVHCTARLQTVRRKVCETQEVTSCATKYGKCGVF